MTTVIIKRYSNNKLYIPRGNTEKAGVVTLTRILEIIKSGKPVKIVDNVTGEDITERILKSALEYIPMSVDKLMEIIRGN